MSRREPVWPNKFYVIAKLTAANSCRTKITEGISDRDVNVGEEACNSSYAGFATHDPHSTIRSTQTI